MSVRGVHHWGRRWVIAILVVCVVVTGILVSRTIPQASAAGPVPGGPVGARPGAPHFTFHVLSEEYWVEYEGGASNAGDTHRYDANFGTWRTWHRTSLFWNLYGDFTGNEIVAPNTDGSIHGELHATVPGIGTVTENDMKFRPILPVFTGYPIPSRPLPPTYSPETFTGARHIHWAALLGYVQPVGGTNNQFDRGNVDNGRFPGVSDQVDVPGTLLSDVWDRGYNESIQGDNQLTTFENDFHARLGQLGLPPLPVLLGLAGGVFFLAAVAVNGVCGLSNCSRNTQRTMVAIGIGLGIISGILGITSGLLTALRAFAPAANAAGLGIAVANEAAGAIELTGATISPGAAADAASIASSYHSFSPTGFAAP